MKRSFYYTDGILKLRIDYLEEDFGKLYGSFLKKRGVPEDDIKFLVMTQVVDGREIPVVDINAPTEYKIGAATHEHFCRCCKTYDEPFEIRDDEHRCADVERKVLRHFVGDKEKFIEQRKKMFKTVIDYSLNDDKAVIERMEEALKYLN